MSMVSFRKRSIFRSSVCEKFFMIVNCPKKHRLILYRAALIAVDSTKSVLQRKKSSSVAIGCPKINISNARDHLIGRISTTEPRHSGPFGAPIDVSVSSAETPDISAKPGPPWRPVKFIVLDAGSIDGWMMAPYLNRGGWDNRGARTPSPPPHLYRRRGANQFRNYPSHTSSISVVPGV